MYSFYGGKQGRTYKLVQHYDSVQQMVELFQQGGSYNEVNYGEYVVIDTIVNNNHYGNPENGIIYRRGLNYTEIFNPNNMPVNAEGTISKEDLDGQTQEKRYYNLGYDDQGNEILIFDDQKFRSTFSTFVQNPGGGAQYVGQIVGPQGQAPELSLIRWSEFLERYQDPAAADMNKNTFELIPPPGVEFDAEGQIVGTIKDTIDYGYLDIKDAYGNITGAYISINIPYSVFRYHAESIEPYEPQEGETHFAQYDTTEKVWKYTNLITEDQISQNHSFYWQYDIKVPKGIRGQDLQASGIYINRALETGDDVQTEDWIDPVTHQPVLDENGDPVTDINYRYYNEYRNYELSAEGTVTRKYIDSWQRTIHKITDNGDLPQYEVVERNTFYRQGTRLAANGLKNGLFLLAVTDGYTSTNPLPPLETFERGKVFTDGSITWQVFEDTVVSPNLITVHYTHGDNDEVRVRLLDDIIINQNNGRIYAKYSDLESLVYLGENQSIIGVDYIDTPWIGPNNVTYTINRIRIKFNTYNYNADGQLIINADYDIDEQGNLIFPTTDIYGRRIQFIDEPFKFVDRIERDPQTREVIVYYNDSTFTSLDVLKGINSIYLENEGSLDQPKYFTVEYDTFIDGEFQREHVSDGPINEIACIQQYGDNIIVLYSDPTVRQNLYRSGVDYAIPNIVFDIPTYDKTTGDDDGNGNLYWINLGSAYRGNHIIGDFSSLTDLQNTYPFGLEKDQYGQIVPEHQDHAGWIATVTNTQTGAVTLYAYNYLGIVSSDPEQAKLNWYTISDISTSTLDPELMLIISKPSTSDPSKPSEKGSSLNQKGYWFVLSERAD